MARDYHHIVLVKNRYICVTCKNKGRNHSILPRSIKELKDKEKVKVN